MEIEKAPPKMAKKLWNLMRIGFYMMRKGISKSKLNMLDLHLLIKQGKIARKAIGNLMLQHHYSTLSCRSDDVVSSFISPREYEFSCSNSPAYPCRHSRRKNIQEHAHRPKYDMLDHNEYPAIMGFPNSPPVRRLRVTDSPFSVDDHVEGSHQVDRDAEKFIKRSTRSLRYQSRIAAFQSPPSHHL
ncbi:hypothetical protein F511_17663 [Dorcoceras hygrometricum]|uniref:Uncharacterized protein n=1 Tax=Dorcoceras hygrometricum TaxID=472368 RepID=A0A2Z7AJU7_9LAMI|nr:hypothetical protein F511_17663 [Dorcoceras hygrometricum]